MQVDPTRVCTETLRSIQLIAMQSEASAALMFEASLLCSQFLRPNSDGPISGPPKPSMLEGVASYQQVSQVMPAAGLRAPLQ